MDYEITKKRAAFRVLIEGLICKFNSIQLNLKMHLLINLYDTYCTSDIE